MSFTLSAVFSTVDRGEACRISYQWHKHRQYKHLRQRVNRIERYRGLWELTVGRSQKFCLKSKTSPGVGSAHRVW